MIRVTGLRRFLVLTLAFTLLVGAVNVQAADRKTVSSITPYMGGSIARSYAQNKDVVGWLIVPGTTINKVVVQNPFEKGNNYYLTHDFFGRADKNGTFCADRRNDFTGTRDGLSQFTTIYGHSFDDNPNGTLFAQLKKYKDADFARTHPYIYLSLAEEGLAFEVFAVFDTTVNFPYVWPELPATGFKQVMSQVQSASLYNYGVNISSSDKILTLSTCTFTADGKSLPLNQDNDYRFVVMARLVSPDATAKDEASFNVRNNYSLAALDRKSIEPWLLPLIDQYGIEYRE